MSMPWCRIPTAIVIVALAVPPAGWAAPEMLRVEQLEAPAPPSDPTVTSGGLEERSKGWRQRASELLSALLGKSASTAPSDPHLIQTARGPFKLFDPEGPPFKLLVAGWVEFQRLQGDISIAPGDGPYLLSVKGPLTLVTDGRDDNRSVVWWLMKILKGPHPNSASVADLAEYVEPLIRAAVRDADRRKGLDAAVAAMATAALSTRGPQYLSLVVPVQQALAALARPRGGLEERWVVVQPGTPAFADAFGTTSHEPLEMVGQLAAWLRHRRNVRRDPAPAIVRVVPASWRQAREWAALGFVPLPSQDEVLAVIRQGGWTPQGVTREVEGPDTLTLRWPTPWRLREGWPAVATLAIVPAHSQSFQGDSQFPRKPFRDLLRRLASPATPVTSEDQRELAEGLATYGTLGRLAFAGIPYGIPDTAAKRGLAASWEFPDKLVAAEAEVAQAEAARARARAAAPSGVNAQHSDAALAPLAQAVRAAATARYTALQQQLIDRLAGLVLPDRQRLGEIRRRLTAFDPRHPPALVRWLRQQGPRDRLWQPGEATTALRRESEAIQQAVAALDDRASPLALHVAELERMVPSEHGLSPSSGTTPDLARIIKAPETLEAVAIGALAASRRLDGGTLRRLEALVQRVQAALRAGWPADDEAQQALRRWQALAVALLSDALALTEPTARGFFDTAGALENDLWYWVAYGMPRPRGLHVKRPGGLTVSSWAEGGVLFLLANRDGHSSIPADRLNLHTVSTMVVRTVMDTEEPLEDLPRATREDAWRVSVELADGLRAPAPPVSLKVGLLLWRPEAVWNVRAAYAHLVSAMANRLGYPMTAAFFTDEAAVRYARVRRLSQDGLWKPALPPLASVPEGSAPTGARIGNLVQRVLQGERLEALPLAELLAVIAHLGVKNAQYRLISTHPVYRASEQRWVWLSGRWLAVPPATTDLAAFVRQELRKVGRRITAWADAFGRDVQSARGVQVRETDGGVLIEYPPLEPLTLTQMAVLQHHASPSGGTVCAIQLLDASSSIRQVRVEISAVSIPTMASGLEEPAARRAAEAFWRARLREAPLQETQVFSPPLVAAFPALQALSRLAPARFIAVVDPDIAGSPQRLLSALRQRGVAAARLYEFRGLDEPAVQDLADSHEISVKPFFFPQGLRADLFKPTAFLTGLLFHLGLPEKPQDWRWETAVEHLRTLWSSEPLKSSNPASQEDEPITMQPPPDHARWASLADWCTFLEQRVGAGRPIPMIQCSYDYESADGRGILHRGMVTVTASAGRLTVSSSNGAPSPVSEGFVHIDTNGTIELWNATGLRPAERPAFEAEQAAAHPIAAAQLLATGLEEPDRAAAIKVLRDYYRQVHPSASQDAWAAFLERRLPYDRALSTIYPLPPDQTMPRQLAQFELIAADAVVRYPPPRSWVLEAHGAVYGYLDRAAREGPRAAREWAEQRLASVPGFPPALIPKLLDYAGATRRLTQRLQPLDDQSVVQIIGPEALWLPRLLALAALRGLHQRVIVAEGVLASPESLVSALTSLSPGSGRTVDYVGTPHGALQFMAITPKPLPLKIRRIIVVSSIEGDAAELAALQIMRRMVTEIVFLSESTLPIAVRQIFDNLDLLPPAASFSEEVFQQTLHDLETRWQA